MFVVHTNNYVCTYLCISFWIDSEFCRYFHGLMHGAPDFWIYLEDRDFLPFGKVLWGFQKKVYFTVPYVLQSLSLYILLLPLIVRSWSCHLFISTLSLIVPADSVTQFWLVPQVILMKRMFQNLYYIPKFFWSFILNLVYTTKTFLG